MIVLTEVEFKNILNKTIDDTFLMVGNILTEAKSELQNKNEIELLDKIISGLNKCSIGRK